MKKDLSTKFNVPENYFSDLEKNITNSTVSTTSAKVIPLYRKHWIVTTGLVASILLVLGIFIMRNNNSVTVEDHVAAKEIIIETYLYEDEQLEEFVIDDEPLYAELME